MPPLRSLSLIFLLAPALAGAAEFTGRVVGVSDGDTITVMREGRGEKVRLHGVDCPEKKQAFGSRAKQFTSELAFGETVRVKVVDTDRYRRTVGVVILPDGRILNEEIVKGGFGWWYKQFAPKERRLQQLQDEARHARTGLWADSNPVPPWEFRRTRKFTPRDAVRISRERSPAGAKRKKSGEENVSPAVR